MFYIYADHLNTPRVITSAQDNKIVWRWTELGPFGEKFPEENPSGLGVFVYNHRVPGQMYDAESGVHQNYFRDFDPIIERYVQSDPIGLAGGMNTFAYVNGNPISLVDRLGLAPSDSYATREEAGTAAVNDVNAKSQATNVEYGGYVYKNPDGSYSYTPPVAGTDRGLSLPTWVKRSDRKPVGDYHTHGGQSTCSDYYPSRQDRKGWSSYNQEYGSYSSFLGTPFMGIKEYQNNGGRWIKKPNVSKESCGCNYDKPDF